MKKKNKIFTFLAINLLVISGLFGCNNGTKGENSNALFLYISGANLEKEAGFATKMLNLLRNYNSLDNMEVYGIAGGTSKWENDYFKGGTTSLFKIKDNNINIIRESKESLGDPKTLADFIAFSDTIKADHKSLLFWGHGSPYGICTDAIFNDDSLTINEINEGLKDSVFDYMIFNCCMGANVDLMSYISDNAKYAIASENNFPASGLDYLSILDNLANDDLSLEQKGKNIIDASLVKYEDSNLKDKLTLSLIDLKALNEMVPTLEGFFFFTGKDPKEFYKNLRDANNINDLARDFVDIKGLDDYLGDNYKEKIIPYEKHGKLLKTNGLYLYYREQLTAKDLADYANNAFYDDYFQLLKARRDNNEDDFVSFETSKYQDTSYYSTRVSNVDYVSDFSYVIKNTNGQLIKEDVIGLKVDFGNYSSLDLYLNEDALFSLHLDNLLLPVEIYSKQYLDNKETILYKVPVNLNNQNANLIIKYDYASNDSMNGKYEIVEAMYHDEKTNSLISVDIKTGDKIQIGETSIIFNNQTIKRSPVESGEICFCVEDIYGKQYYSVPKAIK